MDYRLIRFKCQFRIVRHAIRPYHEQNTACAVIRMEQFIWACDHTTKRIFTDAQSDQVKKQRKEFYNKGKMILIKQICSNKATTFI